MKRRSFACRAVRLGVKLSAGAAASAATYVLASRSARRGQVVLITGGSRGLGLAVAERFGRAGAKLVLVARKEDELEAARRSLLAGRAVRDENNILLISADLTDELQATQAVEAAIEAFGRLDVLVNNAGIIEVGPVENQSVETYERTMATNFFSALYMTYAAMPHMLARRKGAIVNIASIGGKVAVPHMLPYTASKFALVGFSQGLHAELRHKGIRVTTVCPGLMRTGGEVHARFTGRIDEERQWFQLAARTPVLAASVRHAACRIFHAVKAGRTEITITPQAWLAARFAGLAPETTQRAISLVNQYILPKPGVDQPEVSRPFWASDLQPSANES